MEAVDLKYLFTVCCVFFVWSLFEKTYQVRFELRVMYTDQTTSKSIPKN